MFGFHWLPCEIYLGLLTLRWLFLVKQPENWDFGKKYCENQIETIYVLSNLSRGQ